MVEFTKTCIAQKMKRVTEQLVDVAIFLSQVQAFRLEEHPSKPPDGTKTQTSTLSLRTDMNHSPSHESSPMSVRRIELPELLPGETVADENDVERVKASNELY